MEMRITAFEKREDGSLIFNNPLPVDPDKIPDGLFLADPDKCYNTDGYEITKPEPSQPEPTQPEPTIEERITINDGKIATLEESIDAIFGGV